MVPVVTRPFENDTLQSDEALLPADEADLVLLLRRVARNLTRMEHKMLQVGSESYGLSAASRAVHLALVELGEHIA